MSSLAGTYSITLDKGASYDQVFVWKDSNSDPVDLTGYSASMVIRRGATGNPVLATLSTDSGQITLGDSAGTITVEMSPVATDALPAGQHSYVLELTSASGYVTRLLKGIIVVVSEVYT